MVRWPQAYGNRVLVSAAFFLPLVLIGFAIAELIVRWPLDAALAWLAVFGPIVLLSASLSSAALNGAGAPIRFLPGRREL